MIYEPACCQLDKFVLYSLYYTAKMYPEKQLQSSECTISERQYRFLSQHVTQTGRQQ